MTRELCESEEMFRGFSPQILAIFEAGPLRGRKVVSGFKLRSANFTTEVMWSL